ncbi:MAG TPA: DNRLRE domain-containing protein [Phycisphaerales bacterium]|nr:DNRLRE domain-containing protein [Phycisphaerales bacterium]
MRSRSPLFSFPGAVAASALFLAAAACPADTVSIGASKDNVLFQMSDNSQVSNALSPHLVVGQTNSLLLRRAAIEFDVAGAIPAGSTVTAVELQMEMTRTIAGAQNVSLHVCQAEWGEGTSNDPRPGGEGAEATPGDVTWTNRFFPGDPWTTPGGDFGPARATTSVDGIGQYIWSSQGLVEDVQAWLDNPSSNHGWIMTGVETGDLPTAKRFASRQAEDPATRPVLIVDYTPPPGCDSIDFNGDGLFPDNQDIQDFFDVFGGGACSTGTCNDIDFNNDGLFPDNADLEAFFSVFGGGNCL